MSSPTNSQLTTHEVKYNHADPNSATYKVYVDPFDFGMPEQWLNFQTKLRIIIRGNGLDENGPACLTCCALSSRMMLLDSLTKELLNSLLARMATL
jgi:hypothetical protein